MLLGLIRTGSRENKSIWSHKDLLVNPSSATSCCVIWRKLLNLSEPLSPFLLSTKNTSSAKILWRFKVMTVKSDAWSIVAFLLLLKYSPRAPSNRKFLELLKHQGPSKQWLFKEKPPLNTRAELSPSLSHRTPSSLLMQKWVPGRRQQPPGDILQRYCAFIQTCPEDFISKNEISSCPCGASISLLSL